MQDNTAPDCKIFILWKQVTGDFKLMSGRGLPFVVMMHG